MTRVLLQNITLLLYETSTVLYNQWLFSWQVFKQLLTDVYEDCTISAKQTQPPAGGPHGPAVILLEVGVMFRHRVPGPQNPAIADIKMDPTLFASRPDTLQNRSCSTIPRFDELSPLITTYPLSYAERAYFQLF